MLLAQDPALKLELLKEHAQRLFLAIGGRIQNRQVVADVEREGVLFSQGPNCRLQFLEEERTWASSA